MPNNASFPGWMLHFLIQLFLLTNFKAVIKVDYMLVFFQRLKYIIFCSGLLDFSNLIVRSLFYSSFGVLVQMHSPTLYDCMLQALSF